MTSAQWATERYGRSLGDGLRFEMVLYIPDLEATVANLAQDGVPILRQPEDMPWGERIATVADPDGNPVALCQEH